MPQGRGCLERPIILAIIETCELHCVVDRLIAGEILSADIFIVPENESSISGAGDRELADGSQSSLQPIFERAFQREGAHFKAWAMRKAACSRKSRSFSVKASSFSLSTSIRPMTLPESLITGTTISDWVLPNVGR